MPKRRKLLGMPKPKQAKEDSRKRRAEREDPSYYDLPPAKDYFSSTMKPFSSFKVLDDDGNGHLFSVGDHALILPEGISTDTLLPLHEYWVAKILEVRARNNDPKDVWVRSQWYWNSTQINALKKRKRSPALSLGKMELLHSSSEDFVHSACFQGLADVVEYKEDDCAQKAFDHDTFYWRFEFQTDKQLISPAGKMKGTCLCQNPYLPDEDDVMHFCPRCSKSFHESCLTNKGSMEDESQLLSQMHDRDVRFERCLDVPLTEYSSLPVLKQLKDPTTPLEAAYSDIPSDILKLARSPIVRGGEHGVAGNIFPVMRAREFICRALLGNEPIPERWEEEVSTDLSTVRAWIVDDEGFLCPSCQDVI